MTYSTSLIDEKEIFKRALSLYGRPVSWILGLLGMQDSHQSTGRIGQAVDRWLGVREAPATRVDFFLPHLEIKTLGVSNQGQALYPSFITHVAPATGYPGQSGVWEASAVAQKLRRVLWIPIYSAPKLPSKQRVFLKPFLWSPTPEDWETLKHEWTDISTYLAMGDREAAFGYPGTILCLKGKQSRRKRQVQFDEEGQPSLTTVCAFYLKKKFSSALLRKAFAEADNRLTAS